MTSDGNALLRGVLCDPDQDTPRLVYADWLEENGHADRAEFIRVQCELVRWPGCDWITKHKIAGYVDCANWNELLGPGRVITWCPACLDRKRLQVRERELLKVIHSPVYYFDFDEVKYRRGFVERVACTAEDWLAHADAIYWHPEQTKRLVFDGEWSGSYIDRPRPCSDTAQPIRRVVLTTWPTSSSDWVEISTSPNACSTFRDQRWPGIEFELPEVRTVAGVNRGATVSINGGPAIPIAEWRINRPPAT